MNKKPLINRVKLPDFNIIKAVLAVFLTFAWGALAYFVGSLRVSSAEGQVALAQLKTLMVIAPLAAPFLRYVIRISDKKLFAVASLLCSVCLGFFFLGGWWLKLGYLGMGTLRVFLMPILTLYLIPILGVKGSIAVNYLCFHGGNALFRYLGARMVDSGMFTETIVLSIILALSASIIVWQTNIPDRKNLDEEDIPRSSLSRDRQIVEAGRYTLLFVGLQILMGFREVIVFPLAEVVLGSNTESGFLELVTEGSILVGIALTGFAKSNVVLPMMGLQLFSYLGQLYAIKAGWSGALIWAKVIEGFSFSLAERVCDISRTSIFGFMPKGEAVIQGIDSASRFGYAPGNWVAVLPLETAFPMMCVILVSIVAIAYSPIALWLGEKLILLAERETSTKKQEKRRAVIVLTWCLLSFAVTQQQVAKKFTNTPR